MRDIKKEIRRERRRFSRRKREIRGEVREELLRLTERKVREFMAYIGRWCSGSEERGKEEEAEDGKGLQGARQEEGAS